MKKVAFIPARSGSKRIPHKNIKNLGGHPMLAYSVRCAIDSKVFDSVICATDSEEYAEVALKYGAEVPFLRSKSISDDKSPDIEWVSWMLTELANKGRQYDVFSILRPTAPFRKPHTVQRAWGAFEANLAADSLRAVEKCRQHPGKMWVISGQRMLPLMPFKIGTTPWHSSQYAALPEIFVQDASLEIAWVKTVFDKKSIAGDSIIPFLSEGYEGFDINEIEDFWVAEKLIENNLATLPMV